MNSRESAELVRIAASTRRAAGVAYNIRSLLSDSARAIASYPGGHNEGFPDTFKQLFRRFYGYIAAGDFHAPPPFPTFADGDQEIRLCEAVLQSHREQRWVNVQDSIP